MATLDAKISKLCHHLKELFEVISPSEVRKRLEVNGMREKHDDDFKHDLRHFKAPVVCLMAW